MQDDSRSTFPLSNFILFVVISFTILMGWSLLMSYLNPRPGPGANLPVADEKEQKKSDAKAKPPEVAKVEPKAAETKPAEGKPPATAKPAETKPATKEKPGLAAATPEKVARQWVALGSADPNDPYRMLVTLDNAGAALTRIELSSPRYRDIEDRSGYLGHLVMADDNPGAGCVVQVVGPGTPAAKAGLEVGDRITAVNRKEIDGDAGLEDALARTKPGQTVDLTVARKGESLTLQVTLIRRPLEIVRPEPQMPRLFLPSERHFDPVHPEENDPLSFLSTLQQVDDEKIPEDANAAEVELGRELKGLNLRQANWKVIEADATHAVFRTIVPDRGLEITKTYRLAKVPAEALYDADAMGYNLEFQIGVRNLDDKAHKVAYRLDGPNGLPREGAWYASKVGRGNNWGAAGLRDVVYQPVHSSIQQVNCTDLAKNVSRPMGDDRPFRILGVDAQYFAVVMTPVEDEEVLPDVDRAIALRIGNVDPDRSTITNTSFRIISAAASLEPGRGFSHRFVVFAGPKRPSLLAKYDLSGLPCYGWFGWVAEPMTTTLHFFYSVARNYGLAIIMLTVLVRLCMFPLSRKQAISAQKMQKLQPEIKKLQEKYKKDVEGRTRAQQELFRKHNYNPLGGCLVLFVQLPVFIGLYRSLQVDVELRDTALLSHAIRWCSNLAGPDMLFDWSGFMPAWVNNGVGLLGLGPYFNLLPLLTIVLFIVQQKMVMPPPTDDQTAMQQKMMNYMMIFMGVMFYKVAAGLCIYFIASSLWGIAERKFLPKTLAAGASDEDSTVVGPSGDGEGAAARRKRSRGKK